ncbi:MAG: 30S ribosomal protein S6--L-glutamate ligase, partial [Gammaproteobacteria bacterium]|nr:30S ribosomal protein S6--L-glutamate ligase [Gammaproteobacteria bacterium]
MGTINIGFLHSLVRKEEKLLLAEFGKHPDVSVVMLDDRELVFDLCTVPPLDAIIVR